MHSTNDVWKYRIAKIQNDPAVLLWDISEQLNNQKRQRRGNMTPYQLLDLNERERARINNLYKDNYFNVPGVAF